MIRWQSRVDSFDLASNRSQIEQANITHTSCAVPFFGSERNEVRRHKQDGKTESGEKLDRRTVYLGNKTETGEAQHYFEVTHKATPLPVLALPSYTLHRSTRTPTAEGIKTGMFNATTGAAVGYMAGLIFCPHAALAWAGWSALGVGGTTGLVQKIELDKNEDFRNFAERCNEFLIDCRAKGLDLDQIREFRDLRSACDTDQKRDLLQKIRTMLQSYYGSGQTVFLQPIPYPDPNVGAQDPHRFAGYSPAVGVAGAMGGR